MEPKWNQIGTGSILEHSGSIFAHFGQKFDSRSRGVAKCILIKFSSAVLEHVFKLFEVVLKPFVFQCQIDPNSRVRPLRLVGLGSRLGRRAILRLTPRAPELTPVSSDAPGELQSLPL